MVEILVVYLLKHETRDIILRKTEKVGIGGLDIVSIKL